MRATSNSKFYYSSAGNKKHKSYAKSLVTTTALTVLGFTIMGASPAFAVGEYETPTGEVVVGGQASFDRPEMGRLNVHQGSDRLVTNWDSFNIGKNAVTEFYQPNANALAVNVVKSKGVDPTKILGTLKANGQVMVLDRNGVFVGKDAIINASAVTFSTGNIDTDAVMRGDSTLEISDFGDGSIINEGTISVAHAGLVALTGKYVSNRGVINAKMGRVAMAAGAEKVTLDLYGDGLVEIALADEKGSALVENSGVINAEGGTVQLTASAAKDVVDEVINMNGVINATSFKQVGGKIILSGGDSGKVKVSGTMDASGATGGGEIKVKGAEVEITDTADLSVDALDNGDGGTMYLLGRDLAVLRGRVSAKGGENAGNGGFIELSSDGDFSFTGMVDTTAANGETGTFLIDPRDITLRLGTRNALDTFLYESDIEFTSLFTNIILEARRNFTVDSGIYGLGSDGVVTLANNRNLEISTTNSPFNFLFINEADNSGVIDLTGNATYGADLEFKTSGTGTIKILGATDSDQSSNITLSKLTTGGGNIRVETNNGSITWNGDVNSNGGNIIGRSTKEQTVAASLNSGSGNIRLENDANSFDDMMTILSTGSLNSDGGNIRLLNNGSTGGFIVVYGDISTGSTTAGTVRFDGRQNKLLGSSTVIAETVNFTGSTASQSAGSTINAENLQGNLNADANFAGTNNIKNIQNFATGLAAFSDGGFILNNTGGSRLNVLGTISSTGGDIAITNNARLDVTSTGELLSNGGNIDLTVNTNAFIYVDGLVDSTGTTNGDVTLDSGSNVVMRNGSLIKAATLTTNSGNLVLQNAGSQIIAEKLEGAVDKTATFEGATNQIASIGNFATGLSPFHDGGFSLYNNGGAPLNILGTLSSQGGDISVHNNGSSWSEGTILSGNLTSAGGAVTLQNDKGNLIVTNSGDLNAGAGDVNFLSNGSDIQLQGNAVVTGGNVDFTGGQLTQSANSILTADYLTGTIQKFAEFLGTNTAIAEVGDFAVGTAAWYNDAKGLTIQDNDGILLSGTISSTGGDILINSNGSSWSEGTILSGNLTSAGGAVTLQNDKGNLIVTNSGDLNAGAGDVNFLSNGSDIQLQGNAVVTGGNVDFTGGQLTQSVNSTLNAGLLTGTLHKFAHLDGNANQIQQIGSFQVGTAAWYNDANGIRINNASNIEVVGQVSTTGGNIDINNDGDFLIATGGFVDADGDNIDIVQTGIFGSADLNTVRTSGTGTINLLQNNGGSLGEIVGSVENTGTGLNTVTINAGLYNDTGNITDDNFLLVGANAGLTPTDPLRGPESIVGGVAGSGIIISAENVDVDGFTFDGNTTGIQIDGGNTVNIVNNIFSNNAIGVQATGASNGDIALSNNLFNANAVGASFQSGTIDLTGDVNSFIGGTTALQFAPFVAGTPLSLVDNTIGSTFFSGQSSFFVQLANGAFFAPGSPTVLNALDATYDSPFGLIQPVGNLPLSADELNFLEARFFHFTDNETLGLFFYGQPNLNEEDFLKAFGQFNAANLPLNVTITGLPFVTQGQRLAGISPAAGGTSPSALANIQPAAGNDGTDEGTLANLEPAAGAQDFYCWSDAVSTAAGTGASVNMNFGSGFEDLMDGAAGCQTGTF
jgi:filamentous hemagglutinin family protein